MASVKSLGVQYPIGLSHAIQERILQDNPQSSAYRWDISADIEHEHQCEDELLITAKSVIWSRGGLFRKLFNFEIENEEVTHALLTYFPGSIDARDDGSLDSAKTNLSGGRPLARALVVFLKTQAHIYFLSGTSHIVHMPFEVETACAAPVGVVIQRKLKTDAFSSTLKLPKVPPNSFVASQPLSSFLRTPQIPGFSTENLGHPKTLPLRLGSTLANMWQPTTESMGSQWPRLVCLTDPLLELGLVVTEPDKAASKSRKESRKTAFLDSSEELLHLQSLRLPGSLEDIKNELTIAVTINRTTSLYTIWAVTTIENDDVFISHPKTKANANRRRSSMAPTLVSNTASPPHPSMRESFQAPLPGKRSRRDEKKEKALDNALSSLDPERGGDSTRRQSRRVSSLLARADLSTSQDRGSFAEQSHAAGHVGRRVDSHGSQRARVSGSFVGASFGPNGHHPYNSFAEGPVDNLLEELRAGGDFEGFHNMGLDDHELDGLAREMLFTKVYSTAMDNTNVRYSMSSKPAKAQCKVFILVGPPCSTDEEGKTQILVGIQDPVDKRLQLVILYADRPTDTAHSDTIKKESKHTEINLSFGELKRAQSVVDSCHVSDGEGSILILSEDKTGRRELSLQAAWSPLTSLELPLLYSDNLDSLGYAGRHMGNKEVRGRRSIGVGTTTTHIESFCHSRPGGKVSFYGKDGKVHQIKIKLQPSAPLVRKVMDACRSVLHSSFSERIVAGWWHVCQWRKQQAPASSDLEWSSMVILLLSSFLALRPRRQTRQDEPISTGRRRDVNWQLMQTLDIPNAAAYPAWARSQAWNWLLEQGSIGYDEGTPNLFMAQHVRLAKAYLGSSVGASAFGPDGYMPTAIGRDEGERVHAASSIMLALHLLLEEQKLDITSPEDLPLGQLDLRVVLCQISRWLKWAKYEEVYAIGMQPELDLRQDLELGDARILPEPPVMPCVFDWIQKGLVNDGPASFPNLESVYMATVSRVGNYSSRQEVWRSLTPRSYMFARLFTALKPRFSPLDLVSAMHECGFTPRILETLPEAVATPLQDAIAVSQPVPPSTWSNSLLRLINRPDMTTILKAGKSPRSHLQVLKNPDHVAKWDVQMLCQHLDDPRDMGDEEDSSERQEVVRTIFKDDRRLNEAQDLLSSQKLRVVRLAPTREWSEAEYLEKQKELVTTMATSTLAIPSGRGLLYYALRCPLLTQKFHIGGFNLSCTVKPVNNTVGVDKNLFTEEKINWAFFHQGVAGGLSISPKAKGIDTSWILYNKPGQDLSNRHAGFLLALGLNGHLKSVAKWVAFKYLTPKHTMTSIGLLLGLAASYRGTMDSLITRLLSVHVTRMLPRGSAELNLSKHTQTTGIMGIGLVYCGSQHRRMSEIMMSEIEHVDDDGDENPLRDEGYRLAAGFALGFINLAKGNDLKGLHDMRLTEKLLTIATATKRVELAHVLDRAASAAVVAVTLIFMKSEDQIVARKIDVPESILQFDYARPDLFLLRTLAKNLIMWSRIHPTHHWIKNSLPEEYRARYRLTEVNKLQSTDLVFFSIVAGLCFAIGLRFAGSGNLKVRDLLVHYLDEFMRIVKLQPQNYDAELTRSNVRMCLNVVSLSSATVMAGTGDLVVLRRLRSLHGRDDSKTTYGSHMAAHLAIGALFLGCGSITFDTSDLAIASLLVAFYPLFPKDVQDNRSHLQAFRHFWVLATDPRCLVTRDDTTGQPVNVPVLIHLKPGSPSATSAVASRSTLTKTAEPAILQRQTPCLLPPLDDILLVRTDATAQGFWNLDIDFHNKPELLAAFGENQTLHLRRRPPHEGTFAATLRALGRDAMLDQLGVSDQDPIEWVFSRDALRGLTHAERNLVVDRLGSTGASESDTNAVDARLVLDAGIHGWSRDRLLGLRLLFEWADRRAQLAPALLGPAPSDGGSGGQHKALKREASRAKKPSSKREGKKVSVAQLPSEGIDLPFPVSEAAPLEPATNSWWLRDSVVEELKGKTWLAG